MKPRPESFEPRENRRRPFKQRPEQRPPQKSEFRSRPPEEYVPTPKSSRQLAFFLLQDGDLLCERKRTAQPKQFATERLESAFTEYSLSPEERRLSQELLNGTLRRKGTLDMILSACCERPLSEIELELVWLMRIGAYQMVFLDSIPDHAAVNETVDVARWFGKPRWCNFLNANLRSVSRLLEEAGDEKLVTHLLPTRNNQVRNLGKPIFTDPDVDPYRHLSETCSFPLWLLKRWKQHNDIDELRRLCQWFNEPAALYLRTNSLKTSREELLDLFAKESVEASAGEAPFSIRLDKSYPVKNLPGFEEGLFTVQDDTPQQVCSALAPQPEEEVWDMCAAPGTKSTCLAEMMQNKGLLLATDINPTRIKRIRENADRLNLDIIKTEILRERPPYTIKGTFDAILIDAPCSNTGVLGKRSEARWRLRKEDITELAHLQRHLLESALSFLKPNGRIVYSTCSIEPEENEERIKSFLQGHREFELKQEKRFIPGQPADGGYFALLVR
ncbi:Ribosomal RNA small subunit methyltransferase B [Polystyrenella longa]|uniref:Ribosomal RNA small subunit methyltransferase B n=1 Tax=Polystyrenella longa TaxID=2528007 RepID=A0A518CQG0_9PLAN|nr:16S rRNA (cytosine(967)-C(5))-methyltransferase RsmB [Polystyrenella longa]QDU81466.1 Ribosomal RNA small subunit methyltransferase B [Polystyrenella longa]